ncbi:hypothetical protein PTTG_30375 [Puccinia triticina 1-1 BBBD Race 1]|uniref:Zf-4CXXC_R1 domain-containing protein n=1 Tax=Puccinia triticina (isolate 1-1 / race 1 (BBBD)) TaxID=630390 RepID=A0A180FZR1_PUCT1|nr:hypothetical protein PTTG_30375 [Puccinia triticina 1-1 BBBD Race 1]
MCPSLLRSESSSSSDLSSLPSTPPPPPDRSRKNDFLKRQQNPIPPVATEPDETGQYESSSCHQCRVKTTRPKMICDQSQNPNCIIRVCNRCLITRDSYDGVPELRPPIFEFVPGGKMLCVKCRGICPCVACRRQRGEQVDDPRPRRRPGSALSSFNGLTSQGKKKELLKKKQIQKKTILSKPSGYGTGLCDSAQAKRERPSAAPPAARKRMKKHEATALDDIVCLDQPPQNSAGSSSRIAPVKRYILPAGVDSFQLPANMYSHSSQRSTAIQVGPATSRASMARDSAAPKPGRGRPRKAKPCGKQLVNQTLPPQAQAKIEHGMDNTLMNQLLQSNNRLAEAASGMASILQNQENPPDSTTSEDARLERSEKQLKLKMREIELKNAANEAERQKAKAEGFEKAKMMQDFLKSGLSYEKAMEATLIFLGPPL